jgi:hypothetical protein
LKEITSSYDDIEKRMAIFLGLGAMVFSSLYLCTQGADLYTYLVRGVLAMVLFTVVGWAYGHWLKSVIRKQIEDEQLQAATPQSDASGSNQSNSMLHAGEGPEAVIPAEHSAGKTVDFTLPELEPFGAAAPPSAGI